MPRTVWTMEAWLVTLQKEAKTIGAVHVIDWIRICKGGICAFLGQWMWASWNWEKISCS